MLHCVFEIELLAQETLGLVMFYLNQLNEEEEVALLQDSGG
jgi:hypothetical protein